MIAGIAFYSGSIALGLALGVAFVRLWMLCVPRGATSRMASDLVAIAKDMTRTEEIDEFAHLYKRLFVGTGGYLVRNIGGLVLACLPVVLVFVLLAPPVLEAWGRRSGSIAVYPPAAGILAAACESGQAGQVAGDSLQSLLCATVAQARQSYGRTAICWSGAYCGLFALLGFETREAPVAPLPDTDYIAVRPDQADSNFAWPFLSDLEFAFFVAFMLATFGSLSLALRRR